MVGTFYQQSARSAFPPALWTEDRTYNRSIAGAVHVARGATSPPPAHLLLRDRESPDDRNESSHSTRDTHAYASSVAHQAAARRRYVLRRPARLRTRLRPPVDPVHVDGRVRPG